MMVEKLMKLSIDELVELFDENVRKAETEYLRSLNKVSNADKTQEKEAS